MKRTILLAIAAIALSVSAFAQETVTRTYKFGDFSGIDASYAHHIYLTEGKSNQIEVTCPERMVQYLDYGVSSGILRLHVDAPNRFRMNNGEKIIVKIQMEEIRRISMSGAVELIPAGRFKGENVVLKMSGASEIEGTLQLDAEDLALGLSGACEAAVAGTFGKVTGDISGASDLELDGDVKILDIEASGASSCDYAGKTGTVKVQCSGASKMELEGSAEEISIECSGASKVDAEKMISVNAYASANGASSISVYGDNTLELHTSGGSSIKYYGAAKDLRISNKSISRGR